MTLLRLPIIFITLAALLSGCSQLTSSQRDTIWLSRDLQLLLPEPSALGQPLSASQLVSGQYQDQNFSSQFQVELSEHKLVLLALATWGPPLFSATLTPDSLITNQARVAKVEVKYMLADLLITYLPYKALKQSLKGRKLKIVETTTRREIWLDKKLIISVDYTATTAEQSRWYGQVQYHNHMRNYQLEIKTLALTLASLPNKPSASQLEP